MGKTILVTGGGRGIGRAIAERAATEGWNVAVVNRDADTGAMVASELKLRGVGAVSISCDVADEHRLSEAFRIAESELGPLDGVVANAGIEISEPLTEMSLAAWRQVIDVNLTGTFLTVREAVRVQRSGLRSGSIVCVSSPSAFVGFAGGNNSAYGSSKGGISAFVHAAAIEAAPYGIRVNGLVPGATNTDMLYFGLAGEEKRARQADLEQRAADQIPLGRMAQPSEVADAAIWLLGDQSSYVTGSHLVCDGGLLAKGANDF